MLNELAIDNCQRFSTPAYAQSIEAQALNVDKCEPRCADALNPTLRRLLDHCGFHRTFVRGEGAWLWDADGRRFLDFYAQYGAVALGHNPPPVIEAIRQALFEREPAMVQPYCAPHAEALAAELVRLSKLAHCVLASSGAEVVEAAIKLTRARSGRPLILSAEGSYHGKTLGALAATGQPQYALGFGPKVPGFMHFPFGDADALMRCLFSHRGEVAAVLLEPIQGERGVHLPPPGYLRAVKELCQKHDVALVLDEIQTGLGRTGRLFAAEHEGVTPDLLLLAKGLGGGVFPLGACLVAENWWDDGFALRHSSTFANNNLASRIGLAVLRELLAGGLLAAAARQGERLQARLRTLPARFPRSVAAVRGRGLLGAVELYAGDRDDGFFLGYFSHQGLLAYGVAAALAERSSVLVLPSLGSSNVLRLAPPLLISAEEIDAAMDALESVLALLERRDAASLVRGMGASSARHEPGPASLRRRPVSLPRPAPEKQGSPPSRPTYAFILHYTRPADVTTTDPTLGCFSRRELLRYCEFTAQLPPGVVLRAPTLRSRTGAEAEGLIIALPMLPEQMARSGRARVGAAIESAVDLAASLGATVVGLGGYTTPYSRRGLSVCGRGPLITTGNTLTALMAVEALLTELRQQRQGRGRGQERPGEELAQTRVAVVGATGSVGGLCARLLRERHPQRLLLVGSPGSDPRRLQPLLDELGRRPGATAVEVHTELSALSGCQLVLSATGAIRPVLDRAPIAAGTIICDVARPFDASPALRARKDVTVIDGGLVALPDSELRLGVGNLQGLPPGVQLACLSETMLLALAGATTDCGVGDSIDLATAERVRRLAEQHGFRLAAPVRSTELPTAESGAGEETA